MTRIGWALLAVIPTAFLAVFFLWPTTRLVLLGLAPDGSWLPSGLLAAWASPIVAKALANTLSQAIVGTVASVVLGLPVAHLLYRRRWPGRQVVRAVLAVPFVLPSVVVGIAFASLVGEGRPLSFVGPRWAIWAALVFFNVSLVSRIVGGYWGQLDPRRAEAAATLGASPWRVWWTITLPGLRPAVASAASMVFLFCASAYGVVQVLGGPTYRTLESEIWLQTKAFLDLPLAAALSVLQLLLVSISLVVANRLQASAPGTGAVPPLTGLRRADLPAAVVTVAVSLLVVTPLAALTVRSLRLPDGSWGLQHWRALADHVDPVVSVSVWEATWNSLRAAVDATWLALLLGICVSRVVSRSPRSRGLQRLVHGLDAAFMLPLGVSAVTVGFGFLITLNRPPLDLRSSPVLIPIAQALIALPMVVRTLLPMLRSIDPRQREVASTLGAGPWRVLHTLDLVMVGRGLGIAAGFAFAVSLGEFGATSFLARPDHPTLPVLIFRLIGRPGNEAQGAAMAAAVLLALLTAVVMAVAEKCRPREATGW